MNLQKRLDKIAARIAITADKLAKISVDLPECTRRCEIYHQMEKILTLVVEMDSDLEELGVVSTLTHGGGTGTD